MVKMDADMEPISRDECEVAWLAGIVDGEGWIGLYDNKARRHRQLKVVVGNTNPFMVRKISLILTRLDLRFWYQYKAPKGRLGVRDILEIGVSGNRGVAVLLHALRPHLTAKADQADAVLEYLDWRVTLNNTGPVPDKEELVRRQIGLRESLYRAKQRAFSLQRLPRRASTPLELTGLEVMVESGVA